MAVYLLIETTRILDPAVYEEYGRLAAGIIRQHGGSYLAATSAVTSLTPGWTPQRMVLIRFPDRAALDTCFASPEYKAIVHLREKSVEGKAVVIDGEVAH